MKITVQPILGFSESCVCPASDMHSLVMVRVGLLSRPIPDVLSAKCPWSISTGSGTMPRRRVFNFPFFSY